MKKMILLLAVLSAGAANAGETFLGSIVSAAGADTTNCSTAAPFVILPGTRLSIQCTATAYIAVDDLTTVTVSRGITVATDQLFLTKVDAPTRAGVSQKILVGTTVSAVVRIAGPAAVTCDVFSRRGDE